jgi:NADPH2:quinone reductase
MRVVQVRETGGPDVLRPAEAARPRPEGTEVLVEVELAGVMWADVLIRSGRHPWGLPYVAGMEVGGRVVETGPDADGSLLGQRVVATTVGNSGGYAEFARSTYAIPVPSGLSLAHAVAVFDAGQMALDMLDAMAVTERDTVLITAAAGRVGSLLVQLAKATGAFVIAAAGGPEKLAVAAELGADVVVDYREPDWVAAVKAATDGRGADVTLDAIGGELGGQALDATAGRFGMYGLTSGSWTPTENAAQEIVRPLQTVFARPEAARRASAERVLHEAAEGRLVPRIAGRYPLTEAASAHTALERRTTIGAILLDVAATG